MSSVINGVEFFCDNLMGLRTHARETFLFSNRFEKLFDEKGIYTRPRVAGHRFKKGDKFQVGKHAVIERYSIFLRGNCFFSMGAFSSSNSDMPINTIVGRYSSIAHNVQRMHGNHPAERFTTSMLTYDKKVIAFNDYLATKNIETDFIPHGIANGSPVIIGNDVWVGQDVKFISTGITVGDGAIIAAGALVTKNIPPYAIVGGVPAKILKYRFPEEIIARLMELKWWQYGYADFIGVNKNDPIEVFIEKIEDLVFNKAIAPFTTSVMTLADCKEYL